MTVILLIAGLVLLVLGAEALVKGASRLAAGIGISPLVIGLTIVAYGTSAPELAVSLQSCLGGEADIALGNVVGSNIFNSLFILGISALITPLIVAQQLVRLDVPIMIGVSFLCLLFSIDGQIGQFDGLVLFAGGIAYTVFLIVQSRRETNAAVQQEYEQEYGQEVRRSPQSLLVNIGFIAIGLVMLVWGSRWLVEGAKSIALAIGLSDLIVGLTIVAAGTSLPELATSAIASLRGERDIAVGNVVGSNIFNILAVLGLSAAISPSGIAVSPAALHFDLPVMLAVAIICLPIFFTGNLISRGEGLLFLGYYLAYMLYLLMAATQHESLSAYSSLLLFAVIPLTVLLLGFSTWQATRRRRLLLAKRREAED